YPCQLMGRRPRVDHYHRGPAHHHGPEAHGRRDRVRAEYDDSVTGLHAGRAERVGYSSRVVCEVAIGQSRSTRANRLDATGTHRRPSQEVMKHPTRPPSSRSARARTETPLVTVFGRTLSLRRGFVKVRLDPATAGTRC